MLDLVISMLGAKIGAGEVGFLAGVPGSWTGLTIAKIVLALIVGISLFRMNREDILALLTLGMGAICIFNISTIMRLLNVSG